jgi:hypothetical protein
MLRRARQKGVYWKGMNRWITNYIKGCTTCQQNKILTHHIKPASYPISTVPDAKPFQQVAMDLITGLPLQDRKDAILMIVDHGCSHAAIFLPCNITIMGDQVAQLYLNHVFRWYGLPQKIISDRNPRFTSHFWKSMMEQLHIRQNLSTANHPQTDGSLERANQWIEQTLQILTTSLPDMWPRWLALATVIHNNRRNGTTSLSLNQVLLGYDVPIMPQEGTITNNELIENQAQQAETYQKITTELINKWASSTPTTSPVYWLGTEVWLDATHLKISGASPKLQPRQYGPFKISEVISPVAYRLALPGTWTIHNVFHASLLHPYMETCEHRTNYTRPPPDLIDGDKEYEVEKIIKHRRYGRGKVLQYLIKWKGYPESENTWEPTQQVRVPLLIKEYQQ